ncbi:GGDEF domain-containing protein (plasmid) [Streptomyces sp. SDT5-1]|uniref:GGDEF domain-containing protein n=1 Tax=Streptomyces sp. SDT5-1 TaxID=3406418 RepID=UPI003FD4D0F1
MDPVMHVRTPIGQSALFITTLAVPLTGWTVHAFTLHRRLKAAGRDPLTGLQRRDVFTAHAQRLLARHGNDSLVVMVDLDRFKQINDQLGHAAGDAVLTATAARLTAWAGPHTALGRLGGDEFALVLRLPRSEREARLATLMRMLHAPVTVDGQDVPVAASVGAASPDAVLTQDLTQLQRAADAALYDGKHSGQARLAAPRHAQVPSVNGRRAGRPGTDRWGRAA